MLAVLLCFVLSVCQAGGAIGWGSKPPSSTDINSQNDQFLASSRHSDGGDLSQGEEKTWSWSDDDKDSDIGSSSSMTAMAESTSSAQSTSKTSSWWWPWSTSSTSEKEQQYEIIVGQKRKIENNTSLVNSDKEDISNSKNTNTNAALPEDLLEIPSSSSPPSVPSSQAQPAILVKIGQGLFDNLSPFMSQLIVTNMNNFELQDIEVECPIPLVGDIVFRAFNLKVANASVGPSSNLSIANDAIKLAFAGIKFNLGGEYAVSWGKCCFRIV